MENGRAQLVHIEVDRRLGHEWDEWDGSALPNGGDFKAAPSLFFLYAIFTLLAIMGLASGAAFLVAPRLQSVWQPLPAVLQGIVVVAATVSLIWLLLVAVAFYTGIILLPERLAERGPLVQLMSITSRVAGWLGRRDWVENAGIEVYNTLASRRARKVAEGELLVLIPRCLSKATLDGVLDIASRYEVPVFVATRGQLARRAIRERRPRAVIAVACERDMVTGLRDVASKVPVLGLTMQLPQGPCKDAVVDLAKMESWVKHYLA